METTLAQLSSCLNFVRESLKISNHGEVLMMKINIVKQVKDLTTPFQLYVIECSEGAYVKFLVSQDLAASCRNYGQVFSTESPDTPKYQGLVGEKSTVVLPAIVQCELVSEITGATEKCDFEYKGQNQYEITYQPTIKGNLQVEGMRIKGSPFAVTAKLPVEKLGTPILNIEAKKPMGVVVNWRGEVVVTEKMLLSPVKSIYLGHIDYISYRILASVFSTSGERLELGMFSSGRGEFHQYHDVTVDGEGNIFVADFRNHCVQKFTADGQFLSAVGTKGKEPLQFDCPLGITFNATNNKVYVTEKLNFRVQVLSSADLSYSSTFGEQGSELGQFRYLHGIACDNTGNVYVVDSGNYRIQVFTAEGEFLRMFGERGYDIGSLGYPWGIAIDTDDMVYVSEHGNSRVSVFTSEGHFLKSFGEKGEEPGEFRNPCGIAVDSSGMVYVCDCYNDRIQVF